MRVIGYIEIASGLVVHLVYQCFRVYDVYAAWRMCNTCSISF